MKLIVMDLDDFIFGNEEWHPSCFCVEFVEIKFKGRVFARPFQFLSVVIDKADGVGSSVTLHPIRRSVTLHPIRLLKRFSDRKRSATAVSSRC